MKMEGAGNDFVVIDNRTYGFTLDEIVDITPRICDRKFGVGADGILVLAPSQRDELDYTMIYRNADGSDAGMCGNGARCLVQFAFHKGFQASQSFNVHDNVYEAEVHTDQTVSIHFPVHVTPEQLELDGLPLVQANAATEHLIYFTDSATLKNENELVRMGQKLRYHQKMDPPGTNVNFVSATDAASIELQTYERGVEDLTLACGTGAIASAIATHHHLKSTQKHLSCTVHVRGGTLEVQFDYDPGAGLYHQLILKGPANFVFEGSYSL